MFEEALSYPRRGGWRTVLTGGLLILFGFLIVPIFIVYGYTVRVLRSAALGEETTPRFENWGGLLVDGLKAFVIGVAYIIVPYIVMFVALFGTLFAASGESGTGAVVAVISVLIGLVAFFFVFVAAYVLPVALTNFALEDRLGAAFEFRKITNAAFTGDYVVAVLLSMAVGFVVGFIFFIVFFIVTLIFQLVFVAVLLGSVGDPATAAGASLLVGIISFLIFFVLFVVIAFVGFYVQVVTYYLLGRGCGSKLADGNGSGERSPTDPVEY